MFPPSVTASAADVLVTLFDGEGIADDLRLAADLRAARLRVEVYPEPDKLGKQFKYAAARALKFVTVVGGDERAAGLVTIKNMESGEQASIARAELPAWLAAQVHQYPEQLTANRQQRHYGPRTARSTVRERLAATNRHGRSP